MTKAARIMALHRAGKTTREIAASVYGLREDAPSAEIDDKMAYVRVVVRQRKGKSASKHDIRWYRSEAGRKSNAAAHRRMYWRKKGVLPDTGTIMRRLNEAPMKPPPKSQRGHPKPERARP